MSDAADAGTVLFPERYGDVVPVSCLGWRGSFVRIDRFLWFSFVGFGWIGSQLDGFSF